MTEKNTLKWAETNKSLWNRFRIEIVLLLKLAVPVVLTNASIYLILTESILMAGHLSTIEFGAVSLCISIMNVFGLSMATGLATACDTLFSQMFTSHYKTSIGMMLQKSILIMLVFPIILISFYLNLEPLLILCGQNKTVARLAGKYMVLFSPGVIFMFLYIVFTRYLQNQTKVLPPMIVGVVVNIFNGLSQYIAIYQLNFSYEASAVCQNLSFLAFVILIVGYIKFTGFYLETWNGWTKDAFVDWWSFLKLAIPGAGIVLFECFSFEITTVLSGILGTEQLAAQTVVFQIETITFMINFAIGVAVNIRVGNELGAGNAQGAKLAYRTGLMITLCIYVIISSLEWALMHCIPVWFTNDRKAQVLATDTFPIIILLQLFDSFGTVTMGALRGCGRQNLCVVIVFVSYYLMGLPFGVYLAFFAHYSLKGFWIGLLVSLGIVVPIIIVFTNFLQDWQQQADICETRVAEASLQNIKGIVQDETLTGSIEKRQFQYGKEIAQKIMIYLVSFSILIVGILVHLLVPQSSYRNFNFVWQNSTLITDDK